MTVECRHQPTCRAVELRAYERLRSAARYLLDAYPDARLIIPTDHKAERLAAELLEALSVVVAITSLPKGAL